MDGYIVKLNNDTLFGEVLFRKDSDRMLEKIRFRANSNSTVEDYKPREIKAFKLGRYDYSVFRDQYFQHISKGKIDIYERRDHIYEVDAFPGPPGAPSNIRRSEFEESHFLFIKEDGEELEYLDDGKLLNEKMKNRLALYFKDAPNLVAKIRKGYYTSEHILYMAYEFNEPGKYQLRHVDEEQYKKEKAARKKEQRRRLVFQLDEETHTFILALSQATTVAYATYQDTYPHGVVMKKD